MSFIPERHHILEKIYKQASQNQEKNGLDPIL